jgi:diguanylate cyclase (GGDEF)-like protein/PAS domain S-box-containing protein
MTRATMARAATPLTDRRIRATPPAAKPLKLADGGGMYLLVRPDGSRYWRLDYRFDGKRKTLALGVYPEVGLKEARRRRDDAKALLAAGRDPAAVRKAGRLAHGGDDQAYALALIGEGVWDWDLPAEAIRHNAQWARLMGLPEQITTHGWQEAVARVHEADREAVIAAIEDCLAGGASFELEHRVRQLDGHVVWVHNRGEVVARDAGGKPLRMVGSLREITGRKQAELAMQRRHLLLEMIAAVNEMILADLPESELMSRLCAELTRGRLFRMAWIGLVDADGVSVRPRAQAGFSGDYLEASAIRCDDSPQGQGPTGTAIRLGTTVVNNDTESNPQFAPWRAHARALGYRSSAATPIRVHGCVVGALNVYSEEAHAFGIEKLMLLEKLATDLGMAMASRAALAALRESEERFRLLLDSSPEAIYGVDTDGLCTFVNPACLAMLGYTQAEMLGKPVHALIHHTYPDGRPYPKEHCHVRASTLDGRATHVDSEVHWRKDGSSFPVEYWSHPMVRDGELVGAVVTFVDISERKRMEQALRDSEERYRLISSVATDLLYSCLLTESGFYRVDWATASVEHIFGYSVDDIMQAGCMRGFVHADDVAVFDRHITALQPGARSECEFRILGPDGTLYHVRAYSMVVDGGAGRPHRLYGACQDISEARRAEEALRSSEARFRALAEYSDDWIWAMDAGGRLSYTNPRGAEGLGYGVDELAALDLASLVHPDDLPLFEATYAAAVAGGTGWRNVVLRWRHRDGSYRTLESNAAPLFDEGGRLAGFQGVDRDITERRQAEARIEFLAHHDPLTGLPNRVLLRDRFEHALAVARRVNARVAMLFLDLDHFKVVNDTLGHAAGDELLLSVVTRLSRCIRDGDTISRQGGDEFIVLLDQIAEVETVERIAGEILEALAAPVAVNGHELGASCSIGVALYPDDGADFDTLLQKADTAMYNAKNAGRNTYRFFDEQMNLQAHEHLLLQNRLHQALYRAELQLHYQPQYDAGSGRMTGVEALLRWTNPDLGEVSPARFIPVAEDCGLIVPIGAWVLEQACRQAQVWRHAGLPALTMSVNLSALQFRRANLVEMVEGALARSGLPAACLELELTESILLQDVGKTLDTVKRLKSLGVRLAIDDFGTGYSSLSYLRRFAVDRLKIDRSFVNEVTRDPDHAAIVRAIIQLAKSLRLGLIAEGVETAEQLAFLCDAGCPEVQGYLFSRARPAGEVEALLREHAGRARHIPC